MDSIEELNKDSIVIRGLDYDNTYEFRVVAVDGKHTTPSEVESIYTYSKVFKFRVIVTFPMKSKSSTYWFVEYGTNHMFSI